MWDVEHALQMSISSGCARLHLREGQCEVPVLPAALTSGVAASAILLSDGSPLALVLLGCCKKEDGSAETRIHGN
jgi:hypothetical protein